MKFSDWRLANRLTVNTAKTYYMIHTNIITNYLPLPNLSILNEDIFPTDKIKFLGITFDNQFNFKHHISNLSLRISRTIPILLKTKHFAPAEVLKCLYYAHIFPHLNYCNPIWANTYPRHLKPLIVLHKKAIRIMTNSEYRQHTTPLFKSLEIMTLTDLTKLNTSIYMYKQIKSRSYIT